MADIIFELKVIFNYIDKALFILEARTSAMILIVENIMSMYF